MLPRPLPLIPLLLLILLLILLCTLSSCRLQLGLKNVKHLDERSLKKYGRKAGCGDIRYYVDTSFLGSITKKSDANTDPGTLNNHLQPLQCWYFNPEGYPVAAYINCYTKPTLFTLKWNDRNTFGTFPPKGNAPPDSLLLARDLSTILIPMKGQPPWTPSKPYTVVVYWNRLFNRYSRHLIREVKKNTRGRTDVDVLFVNNDRYLIKIVKKS